MCDRPNLIDQLESRTLFSIAAIVPPLPRHAGPQTKAAYTVARTAATALRAAEKTEILDSRAYTRAVAALLKTPTATIAADQAAIKALRATLTTAQKTDIHKLVVDGKALAAAFKAGNTALVFSDLVLVKADAAQLKSDSPKNGTAIKAAVEKLVTDVNASPAVAPLYAKVQADTTAVTTDLSTYQADLKVYLTDRSSKPSP